MLLVGQLWLVMCTMMSIVKWWLLQFMTCSLSTSKFNNSYGQSLMKWCWNTSLQNQILRDSWLIMHRLSKLFTVLGTFLLGWLINSTPIYSIGVNCLIGTPKYSSNHVCKINRTFFVTSPRMQNPLWRLMSLCYNSLLVAFVKGYF